MLCGQFHILKDKSKLFEAILRINNRDPSQINEEGDLAPLQPTSYDVVECN